MAFVTKTWKDRLVEYAGRRKLKNVATGEEVLMDVSRSEGTVSQAGDAFSAANMNNLEQRIKNEFDTVNSSLTANGSQLCMDYHDGKYGVNTDPQRGADTFIPFHSGNVSVIYDSGTIPRNTTKKYTFTNDYDLILVIFIIPSGEGTITATTEAEKLLEYNSGGQLPIVHLYKNIKTNDLISVYRSSVAPAGFVILNIN